MASNDYNKLQEFWDKSFKTPIDPAEFSNLDFRSLAPSQVQVEALSLLKERGHVLDYGCGEGWASIILAKFGCKNVKAVDLSKNAIDRLKEMSTAFGVAEQIDGEVIDSDWLLSQEGQFDGFFSSNVIDVVPLEIAETIIEGAYRATVPGAMVIFSLNFYHDPNELKNRGFEIQDRYCYLGGVLRLNLLKDEEWLNLFSPYFDLVRLDHYAWPQEKTSTRRLFILKHR